MAGPLAAVERFFERLFERPAARLFSARIEPVQIQRGLERAMEAERVVRSRRAYAPITYRVLLSSADLTALAGDRATLKSDLAESLRVYARSHGYLLLARPRIEIEASPVVAIGDVRVFAERPMPEQIATPKLAPPPVADDDPEFGEPVSQATAVFAAPRPQTPRAVLAVRVPGQAPSRVTVSAGTIRVGRSLDNDIVLLDERISRRHGQIAARLGMLVYTDLGSTNGSFMNGSPVSEIALGPGDVLQLGSSTITIEPSS